MCKTMSSTGLPQLFLNQINLCVCILLGFALFSGTKQYKEDKIIQQFACSIGNDKIIYLKYLNTHTKVYHRAHGFLWFNIRKISCIGIIFHSIEENWIRVRSSYFLCVLMIKQREQEEKGYFTVYCTPQIYQLKQKLN